MKKIILLSSALSFIFISFAAISRTCDQYENDKAEYLSGKAGQNLVGKFGGGNNVRVEITACEYNSYTGLFKTNIGVYWDGKFFSENHYNIDGELQMNSDGSEAKFSQTYANEQVKDLEFWRGAIAGAVILGTLASENQR